MLPSWSRVIAFAPSRTRMPQMGSMTTPSGRSVGCAIRDLGASAVVQRRGRVGDLDQDHQARFPFEARTINILLAAFRAVTTLSTAFALTELTSSLSVRGGGPDATIDRFRSLPTQCYPQLVEIAQAAGASTPETEFRRGLAALLDGLLRRGRGSSRATDRD